MIRINAGDLAGALLVTLVSATAYSDIPSQVDWTWSKTLKGPTAYRIFEEDLKVVPESNLAKKAEGEADVECVGGEAPECTVTIQGEEGGSALSEPVVWKTEFKLSTEDSGKMYSETLAKVAEMKSLPPQKRASASAVISCSKGKRSKVAKYECAVNLEATSIVGPE